MRRPAVLPEGRKDIRPPPMMPGTLHMAIQAQRWDKRRMPNPTRRVKKILTMPEGMLRSAAFWELNPRERMRVAE